MVHRYADSTTVRVYSSVKNPVSGDSLYFQRTFFGGETKSISLDGVGGSDVFEVTTTTARPMRLLLYGGDGHDQLRLQGSGRRLQLYDEASDLTAAGAHRPSPPRKERRAYDRLNDD